MVIRSKTVQEDRGEREPRCAISIEAILMENSHEVRSRDRDSSRVNPGIPGKTRAVLEI